MGVMAFPFPTWASPPALSASADPLEWPLAGQDPFFLEQTKKKGVKVRLCPSGDPVRGKGLGNGGTVLHLSGRARGSEPVL